MRGKLQLYEQCYSELRITPADAGKTKCKLSQRAYLKDHPRGCGENRDSGCTRQRAGGSPPRMRGKLVRPHTHTMFCGITPADAGKTRILILFKCGKKDLPRGCGENNVLLLRLFCGQGSPPRMRGKLLIAKRRALRLGITPADAGKTQRLCDAQGR